jgi:hypothetical protein
MEGGSDDEDHPPPPSCDCVILEWRRNRTHFRRLDTRRTYSVFYDDPSHSLHPFVLGILSSKSQALQSATFQIAMHHAFNASYSSLFCPTAGTNMTCPHCGGPQTIHHILFKCNAFWEPQGLILDPIHHNTIHMLFSSKDGRRRLVEFLHVTQALLCPLPPQPTDPPWPGTP